MYSYEIKVGYSATGVDLKMTVPAVLDCFQDAAIFEAENGSITMEYLRKVHQAWLLGSWQIVMIRRPRVNETVKITTFPYDFKGFLGYRNFTAASPDGELLVKGASIWTLIDTVKLRPAKPTAEIISGYELDQKLEMDYAPRKIALIGNGKEEEAFRIRKYQIDSNSHVNNVEYVKMAMEFLPGRNNSEIQELRVEYKRPAHAGDLVIPVVHTQEHKMQVALNGVSGELYAAVEFILQE